MKTEPYSTIAILRRNVAALELALRIQTELKEKAEAELAQAREQKPVAWCDGDGDFYCGENYPNAWPTAVPLFAAPVPVPHKGATHCDDCGLTWLDDGLNPLGCPYCVPNLNTRRYLALRAVGVMVPGYEFVKFDWRLDGAADLLLEGGV